MSALKTLANNARVIDYIKGLPDVRRREEAEILLPIFERASGYPAKMWGASIIGCGSYHYASGRSRQEGDWPLTGFSPRKAKLSVYIMPGFDKYQKLLTRLGKHKTSVSCLYINKLNDVNLGILEELIRLSVVEMKRLHSV